MNNNKPPDDFKEKQIYTGVYLLENTEKRTNFGYISAKSTLPDYQKSISLYLNNNLQKIMDVETNIDNHTHYLLSINELENLHKSLGLMLNDLRKLEQLSKRDLLRDEAYFYTKEHYSYRITKYTVFDKNKQLTSPPEEWTSFSDIGKKVTEADYLITENQYIECILSVCRVLNIEHLMITDLQINQEIPELAAFSNQQIIDLETAKQFIPLILREYAWCKLISEIGEIHFGYDFYLYIVSKKDLFNFIEEFDTPLLIQNYPSPYLST